MLVLSTQLEMDLDGATASAVVTLTEGEVLAFALEQAGAWDPQPAPWKARKIHRRLDATETSWRSWSQVHSATRVRIGRWCTTAAWYFRA